MRDTFRLIAIATLFLIIAFPLKAEQKRDINIESKILEERIKNNEDKTNLQLKSLEKELSLRAENLEKRMNSYLLFVAAIFALITFLGYKTVKRWIKQAIRDKTEEEIKKFEGLLRKKSEDTIKTFLSELENKAKGKISEIEDLKKSYEESLNNLKEVNRDLGKPLPENVVKDLEAFTEKLVHTKMAEKYSFDDWFIKGRAEFEKGEYREAINSWTKAIEKNPTNTYAYSARGLAYAKLKEPDKAVENYNKAIDLEPKNAVAYGNRGVSFVKLQRYDNALKDYNKGIELTPQKVPAYTNLAELLIMMDNYKSALEIIEKTKLLSPEIEDKATCIYLECIAKKLLDMDMMECDTHLNNLLKENFTTNWSCDEIEFWLKEANIPDDKKRFITEKTELLKKHNV